MVSLERADENPATSVEVILKGRGRWMHIVQIVPVVGTGSGIPGAVHHLGAALASLGHTVETFTAEHGRRRPRRSFRRSFPYRVARAWRTVEFSLWGTRRAKRFLAERPGARSICHDAMMAGEIYVDHGVLAASMQAHGDLARRRLRNPLLTFIDLRDRRRYRGHLHRAIVTLTGAELGVLEHHYGRVAPPVRVIPHGVDLVRYRPADDSERAAARARLGLDDEDRVALFIGHELERKGVLLAVDALTSAPTVLLLVVGGHAESIERVRTHAHHRGVADRVLFVGPQYELPPYFAAADMFVFPSAYESFGLVITEALASGVPVIATPVGCAPEIVVDGENGYLVDRDAAHLGDRMERIAATDIDIWRDRCRTSVEHLTWTAAAEQYVALLTELTPTPSEVIV